MRRVWKGVPVALLVLAILLPATAPATDTAPRVVAAGKEFRVVGPMAINEDAEAAVAYASGTNEYLVVWRDGRNQATRAADIYARRVAADGTRPAREERISGPQALGEDGLPAVAYNPDTNEYLVVWQDGRNEATRGLDIYGRRVNAADGKPEGGDVRITGPGATADDSSPTVAYNSADHEFLVAWEDGRNEATTGLDIYGRRVSAAGQAIGPDFRISGGTAHESWPALAYNPAANEYLVVWMDNRAGAWDVYGRRLKGSGSTIGVDFRICGPGATGNEYKPKVAFNISADEYLVVWADERNLAARLQDVYGRRVSAAGAVVSGDFRVSGPGAVSHDLQPVVAYDSTTGHYLVAWADKRTYGLRGYDIYAKAFSATGTAIGGDFRVDGPKATADEELPAVAYNPAAANYLIVWQDYRTATRGTDIYGRLVSG
jgi:hypothetical protein